MFQQTQTSGDAYDNFVKLDEAGVQGANSIGGVFYFQNIFDTVTEGIDVVATYSLESDVGSTLLTASINYGTNEIDSAPSGFFNAEDVFDLEEGTPKTRGVASVKHTYEDWQVTSRLSYYGGYENANNSTLEQIQSFSTEYMFDLEATYFFSETLSVTAGARNLLDNYPDPGTMGETCCGRIYRSDSIVDWQGGYYYTKLNARF